MKKYIINLKEWWQQVKSNKNAKTRARKVAEICRRYNVVIKDGNLWITVAGETITSVPDTWTSVQILDERNRFIAAALKKEGYTAESGEIKHGRLECWGHAIDPINF